MITHHKSRVEPNANTSRDRADQDSYCAAEDQFTHTEAFVWDSSIVEAERLLALESPRYVRDRVVRRLARNGADRKSDCGTVCGRRIPRESAFRREPHQTRDTGMHTCAPNKRTPVVFSGRTCCGRQRIKITCQSDVMRGGGRLPEVTYHDAPMHKNAYRMDRYIRPQPPPSSIGRGTSPGLEHAVYI